MKPAPNPFRLLSRDAFREGVFRRDAHRCVACGAPAQDAHHILERRLFPDGGYYLENGSSLCGPCHIRAEETTLGCDEIRQGCGITAFPLPPHLYPDLEYDKWGNIIQPNGTRLKGELFYDESVQKILAQGRVLDLFQPYVKYPRTYHLPGSHLLKDDRALESDAAFHNQPVVVTLKMDGENTTMYRDYIHARSLNSGPHPARQWVKGLWAQIGWQLDADMRLCGENLYAVHSIQYDALPSYFMLFSVWVRNTCLSWAETLEYAHLLGLHTVPVIYEGVYDAKAIAAAFAPHAATHEGYVVRLAGEFSYGAFRHSVAKYVRPAFRQVLNQSHGGWVSKKVVPNGLAG